MIKVLLIDDDKRHSELLRTYLGRFGIELDWAPEAVSGLTRLKSAAPDLLLLDVMLPGRDGFDICREVRRNSSMPIIMLTATGDVIDRVPVWNSVPTTISASPSSRANWSPGFRPYCVARTHAAALGDSASLAWSLIPMRAPYASMASRSS